MNSSEHRVALVTGASSGLGAESARALARYGMNVVATGRSIEHLHELTRDWPGPEGSLVTVVAEVTDEGAVRGVVARALEEFGRIDALVNSAGTSDGTSPFSEAASVEKFRRVMETNVTGTFLFCREVGAHMLKRGSGSIINISSMSADGGMEWGPLSYTASKAAVEGMTKQLAIEWADRNVRVNAIAPNHFVTRMTESFLADPGFRGWVESRTPMRRIGRIEEWGGAIVFLATDASSYVTGEVLHVDGGFTAARGTYQTTPTWLQRDDL
jgi:NAD(P)-dependent dehydrogenase (short-subunit alcohol dehydrogenase family)